MEISISRRAVILAACLTGIAAYAGATATSSQAAARSFKVTLNGAQQVPPVRTAGSGTAAITYDPATRRVTWSITYHGLSGPVTMAHFHGPAAAGKNGPAQIWLTKKGSPVKSPIKGAATLTAAQAKQFAGGDWYINVHTKANPAGEIRGQVVPPKG